MDIHLQVQCIDFIYSLIAGVMLGISYDAIRIIRYSLRFPIWLTNIFDTIFAFFAALFCFCVVLATNATNLRYFIALGIFLGNLIYELTLSKVILYIAYAIADFIYKVIMTVYENIHHLFAYTFKIFRKKL